MSWQQKLKKQVGTQNQDEIESLKFLNLQINKLPQELIIELSKFKNLKYLSFNQCGLRSLENLIEFPTIIRLEYLDNFTTSNTLAQIVKFFPNLEELIAGGNFLRDLDDIKILQKLNKLTNLNIMNGIKKSDNEIREYAFNLIPSLQILNDKDKDAKSAIKLQSVQKVQEEQQQGNQDKQTIEVEQSSSNNSESAECSDDSENENSEEEVDEDDDEDDSDLSGFIETEKKKVKQ